MTKKKAATADSPLCPGEWLVEFKVVRRIRVGAIDEIDAEIEAAKLLSQKDRETASDVCIVAGRYEDGGDFSSNGTWYTPQEISQ